MSPEVNCQVFWFDTQITWTRTIDISLKHMGNSLICEINSTIRKRVDCVFLIKGQSSSQSLRARASPVSDLLDSNIQIITKGNAVCLEGIL
jgi:hypothetical protein